jgi:hypothetical protein
VKSSADAIVTTSMVSFSNLPSGVDLPQGYRAHQIPLEGGDRSTDSFCYPSA